MNPNPLAERLNQLAAANSQGLLSDDDYRLLRQSLFERYSNPSLIPVEEPIVPVSKPSREQPPHHVNCRDNTLPPRPSTSPSSLPAPHSTANVHSPSRLRTSVSVTNLIRRATGRKSAAKDPNAAGLHASAANPPPASVQTLSNGNVNSSPKRSIIPRILHRKPSNAGLAVSGATHSYSNSLSSPAAVGQACQNCDTNLPYASPHNGSTSTPSLLSLISRPSTSYNHQRTGSNATMTSASRVNVKAPKSFQRLPSLSISSVGTHTSSLLSPPPPSAASINNFSAQESLFIFDDVSLFSAEDVRQAIQATESEFQRLIEEFTALEMHTMHKARLRKARRLYVSTPKDVGVLIEGKEWREYSPLPPSSPPAIHVCSNHSGQAEQIMADGPSPGRGLKSKLKLSGKHKHSPSTSSIQPSNSKLSPYAPSVSANSNGTCLSPYHWSQDAGSTPLSSPAAASASDDRSTRSGTSSSQTQSHSHMNSLQLSKRPSVSPTSASTPTVPPSPMSLRRKGSLSSLSSFTTSLFGGGSKHGSSSGHVGSGPGGATAAGALEPAGLNVIPSPNSTGASLSSPDSGSSMRLRGSGSTGISLSKSSGHLPLSVLSEHAGECEEEDEQPQSRGSGDQDAAVRRPGLGISCEGESGGAGGLRGRKGSVAGSVDTESGSRLQHHQHQRQESVNDFTSDHDHGKGTEDGDGEEEVEAIRRRKVETTEKYHARLHYLRAKLKGAELHERLMKK